MRRKKYEKMGKKDKEREGNRSLRERK